MKVRIILDTTDSESGIPAMLEEDYIFPGTKFQYWFPVDIVLDGNVKKAFDYIVEWFKTNDGELKFTEIQNYLEMTSGNFFNDIIKHPYFEGGLSKEGIEVKRQKGIKGNRFIKSRLQ
ncbi:MAG: hypothetical protein WBX25_02780 [Rhodomicrobium sp.]